MPKVYDPIHYVLPSGSHVETRILRTYDDNVIAIDVPDESLPAGKYEQTGVPYDATGAVGTWHYPEV